MKDIWIISDTHFGDVDFYSYVLDDGITPARPFDNYIEADMAMVENWNNTIKPNDKVYFLGDLGTRKVLKDIMPKLNGKKCLIKGNHDREKLSFYSQWFYDIRACFQIDNYIMTHIPVHEFCKGRFKGNIHGHTHHFILPDSFYYNACVETHNFTPVHFDIIKESIPVREILEKSTRIWDWCYKENNNE